MTGVLSSSFALDRPSVFLSDSIQKMSFESFSRSSDEDDQTGPLLMPPREAADIEKGQERRPQAVSIQSIYQTVRLWAEMQRYNAPSSKLAYKLYALIVIATLFVLLLLSSLGIGPQRNAWKPSGVALWSKPQGFKIIGLVFFGRRATVEILDCYLKKNLVSNGGYLDEVHFIASKSTEEDDAWLRNLVLSAEEYQVVMMKGNNYEEVWNRTVERNHIYIKIDDDLVCHMSLWVSQDANPNATGLYQ